MVQLPATAAIEYVAAVNACLVMSPLGDIYSFASKSAFWRGFSALAPYTGVGPK